MEIKGKINEKLYCGECKRDTNHGYLEKFTNSGNDEYYDISFSDEYYITVCLGCDTIAFYREYGDTEMIDHYENGVGVHYTIKYRYPEKPEPSIDSKIIKYTPKTFEKVPTLITDLYEDVVDSFNSKRYLLSAVGLRMIVEGICKELNVVKGFIYDEKGDKKKDKNGNDIISDSLEGKINGLHDLGVIVSKQSCVLHQVRLLGNLTVHELEIPRRRTIELGIEIIENILHNIFDLENYKQYKISFLLLNLPQIVGGLFCSKSLDMHCSKQDIL